MMKQHTFGNYHLLNVLNFGPLPFVLIKSIINIFATTRHCVVMRKVFEDYGLILPQYTFT